MNNTNALITIGMLSSIKKSNNMDLLDLIDQFFLSLLPGDGKPINLGLIQTGMADKYGFNNIPMSILHRMAMKNTLGDNPILVMRERERWTLRRKYDRSEFDDRMHKTKVMCESVSEKLVEFLKEHYPLSREISIDEAKTNIVMFLNICGISVLRKDSFRDMAHDENMRRTARFIQEEKDTDSSCFDDVVALTKGYMVYNAIYFFVDNCGDECDMDLTDVDVFIDTSLIINMLNYDTDVGNKAVQDMIDLIQERGGKLKVFQHNILETEGILRAFANPMAAKHKFFLENLKKHDLSYTELMTLTNQIDSNIRDCNIEIVATKNYGTSRDQRTINLEIKAKEYFDKRLIGQDPKLLRQDRIENDIQSVTYLVQNRNGVLAREFKQCKSIMITENGIIRNIYAHINGQKSENIINIAYSLAEISSIMWLTSPNTTKLPEDILLYASNAVLQPTEEIIQNMLDYVDKMELVGSIKPHMATFVRNSFDVLPELSKMNDSCTRDETFTQSMFDELERMLIGEKAKEIADNAIRAKEKEYEYGIGEVKTQLEEYARQIKIETDERDQVHSGEMEKVRNEAAKQLVELQRESLRKAREMVDSESREEAEHKSIRLRNILKITLCAVLALLTIALGYAIIYDYLKGSSIEFWRYLFVNRPAETILVILSIFEMVEFTLNKAAFCKKVIIQISSNYESNIYKKGLKKRNLKYFAE